MSSNIKIRKTATTNTTANATARAAPATAAPRRRKVRPLAHVSWTVSSSVVPAATVALVVSILVFVVWYALFVASLKASQPSSSGGLWSYLSLSAKATTGNLRQRGRRQYPDLQIDNPNQDRYNAIALDIRRTLPCSELLQTPVLDDDQFRPGRNRTRDYNSVPTDPDQYTELLQTDDAGEMFDDIPYQPPTAAHLFCLAAQDRPTTIRVATSSSSSDTQSTSDKGIKFWMDQISCPVLLNGDAPNVAAPAAPTHHKSRQQSILDLWSAARAEFPTLQLLKHVLQHTIEQQRSSFVKGRGDTYLWMPDEYDNGVEWIFTMLADAAKHADQGGIYGLSHNLGPGKLFVDVGSGLGFMSMAVEILYPGTKIVSIEAAPPNWLVQQINWKCRPEADDESDQRIVLLLAGVGPVATENEPLLIPQFQPVRWRLNATTAVRGWNAWNEISPDDFEFNIKLTPWRTLLTEAGIHSAREIDVLNVDCEGCEYNFIPALSNDEFEDIATVMGKFTGDISPGLKNHPRNEANKHTSVSADMKILPDLRRNVVPSPIWSFKALYPGHY